MSGRQIRSNGLESQRKQLHIEMTSIAMSEVVCEI